MKKILILNRSIDEGGIDVVGTELAKFLAYSGYEVHLAVLFETNRKKSLPKVTVHSLNIPPSRSYLQKLTNVYQRFQLFQKLVGDLNTDIVIAEGLMSNIYAGLAKWRGAPYKLIMTAHNIISQDRRGMVSFIELLGLRFVTKYADSWVAVSSSVADDLKSLLPVKNIHVIFNAASPKKPVSQIPGEFILSAGRLGLQKDFPTLIRAFRIVADRHPKLKLLIAGAPESGNEKYKDELQLLTNNLDLKGQVVFLGHIANIPDYLASCQLFVMSSIYEGMPIVALDALGIGRAVAATDVPGIKEAVGDAGIYSPIGDERSLAKNIEKILADPELRKDLEKKAKDQAKRFAPSEVNKPWIKILENL